MKIEHFMIVFSTLLVAGLLYISYTTSVVEKANDLNLTYREYLDVAVDGAMDIATENMETAQTNGKLWTEKSMKTAANNIVNTMILNFKGTPGIEDASVNASIPVIMFVDTDGYYLSYNQFVENHEDYSYKNKNGQTINYKNDIPVSKRVYTPKLTWTEPQDNGTVMYTLNNYIYYIDNTGNTTEGTYEEVNEKLNKPEWLKFAFDVDGKYNKEADNSYKMPIILSKIQSMLDFYVNNKEENNKTIGQYYDIELDFINNDEKNMIDSQSLIAFFEGPIASNTKTQISLYSMDSYKTTTINKLPITMDENGYLIYHNNKECSNIENEDEILYYARDKKSAASFGASPCTKCYNTGLH